MAKSGDDSAWKRTLLAFIVVMLFGCLFLGTWTLVSPDRDYSGVRKAGLYARPGAGP